ncbi:MAG: RidA family protein [Gordonia sp. (in: high G+C Gram-positive bacteria)]
MAIRQNFSSGGQWEPIIGYSRAVRVGDRVWVAGTTAASPDGPVGGDDYGLQAREALRRIGVALHEAGARTSDVVCTRIYLTDITQWEAVGREHGAVFGDVRPVASMVEVSSLIEPGVLVEIEAEAVVVDV